jgi:hypothetical protein
VVFLKRRIFLWRLGRQVKIFGFTVAAELSSILGRGIGSEWISALCQQTFGKTLRNKIGHGGMQSRPTTIVVARLCIAAATTSTATALVFVIFARWGERLRGVFSCGHDRWRSIFWRRSCIYCLWQGLRLGWWLFR